jgi:hypothetical protein
MEIKKSSTAAAQWIESIAKIIKLLKKIIPKQFLKISKNILKIN